MNWNNIFKKVGGGTEDCKTNFLIPLTDINE